MPRAATNPGHGKRGKPLQVFHLSDGGEAAVPGGCETYCALVLEEMYKRKQREKKNMKWGELKLYASDTKGEKCLVCRVNYNTQQ